MRHLATFRFFCSHYAFELFDSSLECDFQRDTPSQEQYDRGWYRTGKAMLYSTVGHLNDHRIDVYIANEHSIPPQVDRVLANNFEFPSGEMIIYRVDTAEMVQIPAGNYAVYCRQFNLGVDNWGEDLDDEQFFRRDDLERYELVIVPGDVKYEGVIYGPPTLDKFLARRQTS